jgi:hypothetical protein
LPKTSALWLSCCAVLLRAEPWKTSAAYASRRAVTASGPEGVFGLIKAGELETVKIGRLRGIPVRALDDYINRLRAAKGAA